MSFLKVNTISDLSSSSDEVSQDQGGHFNNRHVEQSADLSPKKGNLEADVLQNGHLPDNFTATHSELEGRLIVLFPDLVKQHVLDYIDVRDLFALFFVCKNIFKPEHIISKRAQSFMQEILNVMQAIGHQRTIVDVEFVFSVSHFATKMDFYAHVLKSERSFAQFYQKSYELLALFLDKDSNVNKISLSNLGYHQVAFEIYRMLLVSNHGRLSSFEGWRALLDQRKAIVTIFHELEMIVKKVNQIDQANPEPILELSGRPLNESRSCLQVRKDENTQQVSYLFEDSDAAFVPPQLFNNPENIKHIYFPDGLLEIPLQILQCVNLTTLTLLGCTYLERLPPEIGQLQSLISITFPRSSGLKAKPHLKALPDEITQLKNLKEVSFNEYHNDAYFSDCYENGSCAKDMCTYFFQNFTSAQQEWLWALEENGCAINGLYIPSRDED